MNLDPFPAEAARGWIRLHWLSRSDPQTCFQAELDWTDGAKLEVLPELLEACKHSPQWLAFPWFLIREAKAYSRWGLRLRWDSPIYLEDELAILEAVTADAKRWRLEQARRQRQAGRRV